jgi:rhamnogalacturonan endolyase
MPRPMPAGRRRALRTLLAFLTALTIPLTFALTGVGPTGAVTTRYEAENAVCQGTVDSDHTGFSGTGFCNATNAVVSVGDSAAGGLPFPGTGSWDTWANATVMVTLAAGTNTVRATATTSNGGPNIDYLDVAGQ